jgi:hypothetical protein
MKALAPAVIVTVLLLVGAGEALSAPAAPPPCGGRDLRGSFDVVRGSAGAGSITYRLKLTNTSSTSCWVSGIPRLRLLGVKGGALPTTVRPARPGQATAARIVLHPGHAARADARFSPDVPGPGEQQPGACEPTAHRLRVTIGGSSVIVPVRPPTPACEHGTLSMSLLTAA